MNTDVRNFLIRQRTNEINDAFALRSLLKNLSSYSLLSGFYGDFYIWFWNSDYVISRKDAYSSREFFELSYPKGESYEAWAGTRKQNTPYLKFLETSVVGLDSVPKRVLEYAVSLPLGVGAGLANGCISVLVDEQSVRQMLARIGDGQESFAYLADAEGTIITSVSPDGHIPAFQIDPSSKSGQFRTKIDSRETYISYTRSSNGKWLYVVGRSAHDALAPIRQMGFEFLFFIVCSVAVVLIASIWFSWHQTQPLRDMCASLATKDMSAHDMQTLRNAVQALVTDHERVLQESSRQSGMLEGFTLLRLLKGSQTSGEQYQSVCRRYHLPPDLPCQVVVLWLKGQEEPIRFSNARLVVMQKLSGAKPFLMKHVEVEPDTVACVCFGDDEAEVDEFFSAIHAELIDVFKITVILAKGSVVSSLKDVHLSYAEASYALQNRRLRSSDEAISTLRTFSDLAEDYTFQLESTLLSSCESSNYAGVKKALDGFFNANEQFVHTDNEHLQATLSAVKQTMRRAARLCVQDIPARLRLEADINNLQELDEAKILSVYRRICERVMARADRKEKDFDRNLLAYVDEHLSDPSLSLSMVAGHFQLSDAALSLYFSRHLKTHFATYVQKGRMETASTLLLKNRSLSIDEVALRSGYGNAHTFRRVFKKRYGMNPAEYRDRQKA